VITNYFVQLPLVAGRNKKRGVALHKGIFYRKSIGDSFLFFGSTLIPGKIIEVGPDIIIAPTLHYRISNMELY
jgi:hypothetical protein